MAQHRFSDYLSKKLNIPVQLAQQDNENGMMEAACPQAVSAGLANSDGGGGTPPPSTLFSWDLLMPARLAR